MIIIDTNVVSALMVEPPPKAVVQWLDGQPPESVWTTSVTLFEIAFGIAVLPKGRRRASLEAAFAAAFSEMFGARVLAFDEDAARHSADLAARLKRAGRPLEIRDLQIAGIAIARRAHVATRNTRHFEGLGLRLVDPWNA